VSIHRASSILFFVFLAFSPAAGQDLEYRMKAVFLDKFTHFVQWPETSVVSDTSLNFVVGVIGESPFGSALERIYAERRVKNKTVEIQYLASLDEIARCNLLFIAHSAADRLSSIIARTRDKPILTVSDTNGFAEHGVLINFYRHEGKVKFEINEGAAHASGLTFSYLLLNLARIVNPLR
jgi:hypothetical protein